MTLLTQSLLRGALGHRTFLICCILRDILVLLVDWPRAVPTEGGSEVEGRAQGLDPGRPGSSPDQGTCPVGLSVFMWQRGRRKHKMCIHV